MLLSRRSGDMPTHHTGVNVVSTAHCRSRMYVVLQICVAWHNGRDRQSHDHHHPFCYTCCNSTTCHAPTSSCQLLTNNRAPLRLSLHSCDRLFSRTLQHKPHNPPTQAVQLASGGWHVCPPDSIPRLSAASGHHMQASTVDAAWT